jgi:hypothetical protein
MPPTESNQPTTSGREGAREGGRADAGRRDDGLAGWLQRRVTRELSARKNRVSDRLGNVAESVRRASEPLRAEPFPALGGLAENAARRIERVADGLRERELDELAEDVRGFARHRPGAFIGAGLAAGLIAGRFLRSSGPVAPERKTGRQALGPGRQDQRGRRRTSASRTGERE